MSNTWKPKGWIAIVLGIFLQPITFLYVNRAKLFWLYLLVNITFTIADYFISVKLSEESGLQNT